MMSEATVLSPAQDWREGTRHLIDHWTNQGRCYSSGEVAAALRTHRQDLRFSVTTLGEYVRDLFYQGELPSNPVQVSRRTTGNGRTPEGLLVFVYGPDEPTAEAHNFEVEIPRPLDSGKRKDRTPKDRKPKPLPQAYVGKDGRCYVPRKVVETWLGESGLNLRFGDKVFVTPNVKSMLVSEKALNSYSQPYNIWQTTGRVVFPMPYEATTDDKFDVEVSDKGIVVVL